MSVMTTAVTTNIPVARPCFSEDDERAVIQVLRSGWVSQGPKVAEFEKRFAEYVGAEHAIAVSSCTTALHLALAVSGIESGDEVLCPSLSFIATANAIAYLGARPVFVDVDLRTYNIDPACIERAITDRTKAILLVHQIGLPADLDAILDIANRRGVKVIEDAACAAGSQYHGKRIGAPQGELACFSFHPRKVLTTGEGGMITTADSEAAARLRRLRQHAMSVSDLARHSSNQVVTEHYDEVGYNYRLTDLQAAVGIVQLGRLNELVQRRRFLAQRYSQELSKVSWLVPPYEPENMRSNYQSYMVRLTADTPINRDELMQHLLDRGISSRRGIMASHREKPYWDPAVDRYLPNTNLLADTAIILPVFHQMTDEQQEHVITSIREVGR
jgi:dTDP-4-amino-4,6-dideoxygalactose transaminase